MKRFLLLCLLFISLYALPALAQEQQVVVPYTLADRDRAIRTEAKFEAVNVRIDMMFWIQGGIFAFILFILGFTIWDRRTALKPALDRSDEALVKSTHLSLALREYSKKHPDLADILRSHGIL